MTADLTHFRQPQNQRLARFAADVSADVHCHCLPGVDDGPSSMAEAIALCQGLINDGITTVIATPHQLGPYEQVTASLVRQKVAALQQELASRGLPLRVLPGAEVRADDRLARLLDQDELLTLGDGGAYLLLEMPHSTMLDLRPLIDMLLERQITPIISHPERTAPLTRSPQLLLPWLARGALLQVTSGSLTGLFGPGAQRSAWEFVEAGWVALIASDAHDMAARAPAMSAAIDAIAARRGHAVARRLCIQNPQLVLENRPIPRAQLRGQGARA